MTRTFLSPGWLWLLLAVAALLGVYLVLQLRRRAFAVRFANLDLLGKLAPKRPGWRRHLAFAALLLALASLTTAMAKPTKETKVPRDRATVMMAIDVSLSMRAEDVSPNRLAAAQAAAKEFVGLLPPRINLGLVTFSGTATVAVSPTTDRASVLRAIDNLELAERTAIGEAVFSCLDAIKAFQAQLQGTDPSEGNAPARIVLMSDGEQHLGPQSGAGGRGGEAGRESRSRRSRSAPTPATSTWRDSGSWCRSTTRSSRRSRTAPAAATTRRPRPRS